MMEDNPDIALITQQDGIYPDQMDWINRTGAAIRAQYGNVPALMFMHIPIVEVRTSAQAKYPDTYAAYPFYPNLPGDEGVSYESMGCIDTGGAFWKTAKANGVTGMFFAHQHVVCTSIVYDGIRLAFGMKSSTYDYHHPDWLGSMSVTLGASDGALSVAYHHTELPYQKPGETAAH